MIIDTFRGVFFCVEKGLENLGYLA